jgi:hypothetical protein
MTTTPAISDPVSIFTVVRLGGGGDVSMSSVCRARRIRPRLPGRLAWEIAYAVCPLQRGPRTEARRPEGHPIAGRDRTAYESPVIEPPSVECLK